MDLDFIVLRPEFEALFWIPLRAGMVVGAVPYSNGLCYSGSAPTQLYNPLCVALLMWEDGFFNAGMLVITPREDLHTGLLSAHMQAQERAKALDGQPYCVTSQPVLNRRGMIVAILGIHPSIPEGGPNQCWAPH